MPWPKEWPREWPAEWLAEWLTANPEPPEIARDAFDRIVVVDGRYERQRLQDNGWCSISEHGYGGPPMRYATAEEGVDAIRAHGEWARSAGERL